MMPLMSFVEYQHLAHAFAIYPEDKALHYLIPGLMCEVLEVREKLRTYHNGIRPNPAPLIAELGDVLWFCAEILTVCRLEGTYPHFILNSIDRWDDMDANILLREAQTLLDRWVKCVRSQNEADFYPLKLSDLSGVVHWVSGCVRKFGDDMNYISLLDVADLNIHKLRFRAARNVIGGTGDDR